MHFAHRSHSVSVQLMKLLCVRMNGAWNGPAKHQQQLYLYINRLRLYPEFRSIKSGRREREMGLGEKRRAKNTHTAIFIHLFKFTVPSVRRYLFAAHLLFFFFCCFCSLPNVKHQIEAELSIGSIWMLKFAYERVTWVRTTLARQQQSAYGKWQRFHKMNFSI